MLPSSGLWMALFWGGAVLLVLAGFARARRRLTERVDEPRLDDQAIRAIEETGFLRTESDEPLDLEAIEDEERRFWQEERWDEAEDW